jgi:hypothetical protein
MNKCSIYDSSLRFSRATYGIMVLVSFFMHNQWLLLITSILMVLGIFSLKLNIPYQFHKLIIRRMLNEKSVSIQKESGELNFVAGMTAVLLFIGFLLIHYDKFVNFAWIYVLVVDFLIFLACFVGFCIATLMYVFFRKIFIRK